MLILIVVVCDIVAIFTRFSLMLFGIFRTTANLTTYTQSIVYIEHRKKKIINIEN